MIKNINLKIKTNVLRNTDTEEASTLTSEAS